MTTRRRRDTKKENVLEKKAWFLCKFLASTLDEESFENLRKHVSVCKGIKTRVKLSDNGWAMGYKTKSIRGLTHRLKYETFPLQFITELQQDSMFVNVLLCILRMHSTTPAAPNHQYEIIAFKFADSSTVQEYQKLFRLLTGGGGNNRVQNGGSMIGGLTGGGRDYRDGALMQEGGGRWETSGERLGNGSAAPSEISFMSRSMPHIPGPSSRLNAGPVYLPPSRSSLLHPRRPAPSRTERRGVWWTSVTPSSETTPLAVGLTSDERTSTASSDLTSHVWVRDVSTAVGYPSRRLSELGGWGGDEEGEGEGIGASSRVVLQCQRYRPRRTNDGLGVVADVSCQIKYSTSRTASRYSRGYNSGGLEGGEQPPRPPLDSDGSWNSDSLPRGEEDESLLLNGGGGGVQTIRSPNSNGDYISNGSVQHNGLPYRSNGVSYRTSTVSHQISNGSGRAVVEVGGPYTLGGRGLQGGGYIEKGDEISSASDSLDGPLKVMTARRLGGSRGTGNNGIGGDRDNTMTSFVNRQSYSRPSSDGRGRTLDNPRGRTPDPRGRTPDDRYRSLEPRFQNLDVRGRTPDSRGSWFQAESTTRSRSQEPIKMRGSAGRDGLLVPVPPTPRAYLPSTDRSDVVSVKTSQSTTAAKYVSPNFTKVYAARTSVAVDDVDGGGSRYGGGGGSRYGGGGGSRYGGEGRVQTQGRVPSRGNGSVIRNERW